MERMNDQEIGPDVKPKIPNTMVIRDDIDDEFVSDPKIEITDPKKALELANESAKKDPAD